MFENLFLIYAKNQNVMIWIMFEISIILVIAVILKYFNKINFSILFELFYEKVYSFYENILWQNEKKIVKTYVVVVFFIILISNLMGLLLEFIAPIFWTDIKWDFILEHHIINPTLNLNFTLALSISSVIMILFIQYKKLWAKHFFLEYIPITWKWYIVLEKWKLNTYIFKILNLFTKLFDIILSIFIWILELIWMLAKIISLAFRLFWNMISWSILITIIVVSLSVSSKDLTSFIWWFHFPIILPIFIYLQELLIALVQAFIFPMLISIFIKTSSWMEW